MQQRISCSSWLSRQTENLSPTVAFHLAGYSSGHKPKRVLRLERRLRIKYAMLQQHWVILCLTLERRSHRDEISVCMCESVNLMSQSLLHQRWSKCGSRCSFSFPFLLASFFSFFFSFFCAAVPPPGHAPHGRQVSVACMTFSWTIIIKKKKRVLEFRAPVVSMQGQLQTWISLQIKESLWGPNPVRHSLGRLYKGSTLNPWRVQLNEITPVDVTHCDSSSPFLHPSISRKKWWVEDW